MLSLVLAGVFWLGVILLGQLGGDVVSSIVFSVIILLILGAGYFLLDAPIRGIYGMEWYYHVLGFVTIPVRFLFQIVTIVCMHVSGDDYFGERKDYVSTSWKSCAMYSLFTASSLEFEGWGASDRAARHRSRGYAKSARAAKRSANTSKFLEGFKDFFVRLGKGIIEFVTTKIIPTLIIVGVLAALLLLPDYHADIDRWLWSDLDRLGFLLFVVITSAVLIADMFSDESTPLWIFCFLATVLAVSFIQPKGALSAALAFYGNVFFILYSVYFLVFVGIFNFSVRVDDIAKKVVAIASGATLVISVILAYILSPMGIYLPSKFTLLLNEELIPIPLLICGAFMVIAALCDKSNVHINVSSSGGSRRANISEMESAAKDAASVVPYAEFGSVTGGTVTIYISVGGYQANKQRSWFMDELKKSLNGKSASGWNFKFLTK